MSQDQQITSAEAELNGLPALQNQQPLQPNGDVVGGIVLSAVQAARKAANHNEPVASETGEPVTSPDQLEDLAVSDEQSGQVAGGLPAVQKVREAAARIQS